jgi:hypothetical protein
MLEYSDVLVTVENNTKEESEIMDRLKNNKIVVDSRVVVKVDNNTMLEDLDVVVKQW